MERLTCPKCHEENPTEAVICWACYTPLGNEPITPLRVHPDERELHFRSNKWKELAQNAAPPIALVAMVSSGWWKGKVRYGILGTSLGVFGAALFLEDRARKKQQVQSPDYRDPGSPICRITDTIMLYAVKDGASRIQITMQEKGIKVEYFFRNEWHEQMKIPIYVWASLKNEFSLRAGRGKIHFDYEGERGEFSLRILVEPPHEEILLIAE